MKNFCIVFLLLLILPIKILAISQQSLKKYPYKLLTNDYGILNEANLKRYVDGMNPEQFKWHITGLDYWQCFPTKDVTVWFAKIKDFNRAYWRFNCRYDGDWLLTPTGKRLLNFNQTVS